MAYFVAQMMIFAQNKLTESMRTSDQVKIPIVLATQAV
jgi:hypothetical protein